MTGRVLLYGTLPVPWTVSWTAELKHELGEFAGRPAIVQPTAHGTGKPDFKNPHFVRQRMAMHRHLCDLCGRSLKSATKVSLSDARPSLIGASAGDVLQVEPLLHKACAATSLKHCPHLSRKVRDGEAYIRHVMQHRIQNAIVSADGVEELTGIRQKALGYAKVQLLKWADRDVAWLNREREAA